MDGFAETGTLCAPREDGSWGACGGFSDPCDETGTQARAVTRHACAAGLCDAATSMETRACTRTVDSCVTFDRTHCAGSSGVSARHCQIDIRDPANDSGMGYFEYLPPTYDGVRTHPVIIFFHGLGEVGNGQAAAATGLDKVDNTGLPQLISRNNWPPSGVPTAPAALANTIVLSPQQSSGCHPAGVVAGFIDWVADNYPVDLQRVYVTGLSCGGIATWNYLRSYFKRDDAPRDVVPAAIVPIAGNGGGGWGTNNNLCGLGRLPIWAFHGDPDGTVATSGTTNAINGLNTNCTGAMTPVDARMTLYPGLGHTGAVWTGTYDGTRGHDIYTWMFSYTAP